MLILALVGASPFLTGSCTELMVKDLETGLVRPATPEEAAQFITEGGEIAKVALAATGHVEWYPFIDIAVRLAVLVYAIRFGRPPKSEPQASPTEGDS